MQLWRGRKGDWGWWDEGLGCGNEGCFENCYQLYSLFCCAYGLVRSTNVLSDCVVPVGTVCFGWVWVFL